MSLATNWRPSKFEDVCGQKSIIKILERQIETKDISNCYLFCGPSGTGKTTLARIFANKLNNGCGNPIEIDGASNNGVDNVREIIDNAKERSIDSTYKVFIIDEVHMLTLSAWNALLKTIEEPPKYTVFIFCTTDPQKIPATIINRVMRFNLSKVATKEIGMRLTHICEKENFTNYIEACDYISKISDGGVRDAISLLEKCSKYSTDLNMENVITSLGNCSYNTFFDLTNAILDKKDESIVAIIESYYNKGNDLKLFIDQYLDFILDLTKYCIFKDISVTKLPLSTEKDLKYVTGIEQGNTTPYFKALLGKVLTLKNSIRNDSNIKSTIIITLLNLGEK